MLPDFALSWSHRDFIVGGKVSTLGFALSGRVGVGAVDMGSAVEHPYGKLGGGAGAIW